MAFLHGKDTRVFFNTSDLSGFFNDASVNRSVETAETTAFGGSAKSYIVGLEDGTISISGMFDGAAGAVDDVLQSVIGTENAANVTICFGGATAGNRVSIARVEQTSYDVSAPVSDVVAASAELQADDGIENGIALISHTGITTTGNGSSQDHGASTTDGGVAMIHVTANTRDGSTTFKVQHSADNSSWADLATFASVSATTTASERLVVAAGTTVNRYLRASYTLSGTTGTITTIISFARR